MRASLLPVALDHMRTPGPSPARPKSPVACSRRCCAHHGRLDRRVRRLPAPDRLAVPTPPRRAVVHPHGAAGSASTSLSWPFAHQALTASRNAIVARVDRAAVVHAVAHHEQARTTLELLRGAQAPLRAGGRRSPASRRQPSGPGLMQFSGSLPHSRRRSRPASRTTALRSRSAPPAPSTTSPFVGACVERCVARRRRRTGRSRENPCGRSACDQRSRRSGSAPETGPPPPRTYAPRTGAPRRRNTCALKLPHSASPTPRSGRAASAASRWSRA